MRRGGLYVAVAALLSVHTGCGGGDNGQDWEEVTVQEPTKGVITTIEETESGSFSIVDEKVVSAKDSSRVVIKRLDGTTETLTLDQARGLVQPQDTSSTANTNTNQPHYRSHGMGLGHVMWWGAMGYMMGRSFSSPINSGVYRGGYNGGAASELRRTAVSRTTMRPVSGKSGFFGRSSRGSSGG